MTGLESKYSVFDMRTFNSKSGYASLSQSAHKSTIWYVPRNYCIRSRVHSQSAQISPEVCALEDASALLLLDVVLFVPFQSFDYVDMLVCATLVITSTMNVFWKVRITLATEP